MLRRERALLWAGLLLLLTGVGLVGVVYWLAPESSRPELELYDKIHTSASGGMTRAEVEQLLGPPGDYATGCPTEVAPAGPKFLLPPYPPQAAWWKWDQGEVVVFFDESDRAQTKSARRLRPVPLLTRLRRWLGL
jgi:hypothetical protein